MFFKDSKFYLVITIVTISIISCYYFTNVKNIASIYFLKSTGAFVRQAITEKINIQGNLPNKFEQFKKHCKFLLNSNEPTSPKGYFSEKFSTFNLNFPNYNELHVLFNEIFVHKEYYFETNSKEPFIVDCGSNIGMSVLFFKLLYPNSKILAFEPSKKCFNFLTQNIKNNNFSGITLYNKALSNKKEKIKLFNTDTIIGSAFDRNQNSNNFEIVEAIPLSKCLKQEVDLLKLDIEGMEDDVIEDLEKNDKLSLIKEIIMEYHYPTTKNNLSKILTILEKNNFIYQIKSLIKTPFNKENNLAYLIYAYKK